jgi:ribosome-associated protein
MTKISATNLLNKAEVKLVFIRSPGPGGQNVNKVATGVLLRFNIKRSPSLPDDVRARLFTLADKRVRNIQGDILIKATRYRTQARNKHDALYRLQKLLDRATIVIKNRKKTKPTLASKQRRLNTKRLRAQVKSLRSSQSNDVG